MLLSYLQLQQRTVLCEYRLSMLLSWLSYALQLSFRLPCLQGLVPVTHLQKSILTPIGESRGSGSGRESKLYLRSLAGVFIPLPAGPGLCKSWPRYVTWPWFLTYPLNPEHRNFETQFVSLAPKLNSKWLNGFLHVLWKYIHDLFMCLEENV